MKIALCQINTIVGDIHGNAKKIISVLGKTEAELLVFPELCIVGYPPQDLLLHAAFIERNRRAVDEVASACKGKACIVGFVEHESRGPGGMPALYNAAAFIEDGRIKAVHRKTELPNYAVFDEKRWFMPGTAATVVGFSGRKIGLQICEDTWLPTITAQHKKAGADIIISISASPYSSSKIETVRKILHKRWDEAGIPIMYVNQIGGQDGIVFHGASMLLKDGNIREICPPFEESIAIIE